MLSGDNGILQKATQSKEKTERAEIVENAKLDILAKISEKKGENITESELEEILTSANYNTQGTLSNEESVLDRTLTSKDGKYTIAVTEIYSGGFVKAIEEKTAKFIDNLSAKTHIGASAKKIERATQEPDENYKIANNIVSTEDSDCPIYMWYDSSLYTLYWYSEANNPELPSVCPALFAGFTSLIDATGIKDWNTSNVTNMNSMFAGCSSLTSIDVSKWDTGNVADMTGMFSRCSSLTSIDVSKWDTRNVTTMDSMFIGCLDLPSLNLSSWNTKSVTNAQGMFNMENNKGKTSKLTTIIVSGDFAFPLMNRSNDSPNMFKDCTALVGGNGTTYTSLYSVNAWDATNYTYARIDTPNTPGYLTASY